MTENNTFDQVSTDPLGEAVVKLAQANEKIVVLEAKASANEQQVANLEQQVKNLIEDRDNWMKWCTRADDIISKAKEQIETAIARGDIEEDELEEPFWVELFATLGVESHEVVEVDVVATWSVSITKPRGRKLNGMDFTAELQLDSSDITFDGYVHSPEVDISEN